MLPKRLRFRLFEVLSLKTMRYVHAIPRRKASGLVAQVYSMIEEDFFINGSLTSRSKTPALMAGIWTAGRESILVHDRLDRITKEAMVAVLSDVNDCPYCGDMLISLVHAGGKHEAASNIFSGREAAVTDCTLRARLAWVRSVLSPGTKSASGNAIHGGRAAGSYRSFDGDERHQSLQSRGDGWLAGEGAVRTAGRQGRRTSTLRGRVKSDPGRTAGSRTSSVIIAPASITSGYAMGNSKSTNRGCDREVDGRG